MAHIRPKLTIAQAECILEMLCHASELCGDGKERPLVVYERAARAVADAMDKVGQ